MHLKITTILLILSLKITCVSAKSDNSRDSLFTDALLKKSQYNFYTNPDSALYFATKAYNISDSLNNNFLKSKSLNFIGIVYDVTSKWDSALIFYDRAIEYADIANSVPLKAGALNNKGLIYWNKGEFDIAIKYFNKSIKLYESYGNKKGIANNLNNIGLILEDQKFFKEALKYQRQSLKIRKEINDEYGISASYMNIANLIDDLNYTLDSIRYYLEKSIEIKEKINDKYGLAIVYTNLGLTYRKTDIEKAEYFIFKSIDIYRDFNNSGKIASSIFNLAASYFEQKDYDRALDLYDSVIFYAKDAGALDVLQKCYGDYAVICNKKGNYKKAFNLLQKKNAIHDSIYAIEKEQSIIDIKTKYETEKKDKEIASQKLEIAESELKISKRNKWLLALIGAILSLFFLGLALIQRNKRRAQLEKDKAIIKEKEKGLEAILHAQEEEREKIAKDLHDGIGQQIGAINLYFQSLIKGSKNDSLKNKYLKIADMIKDTAANIRTISHKMMPPSLIKYGLIEALNDIYDNSFKAAGIDYDFNYSGFENRIPDKYEKNIYRINQELVNNVIKHSEATKINVEIELQNKKCRFKFCDNGKGMKNYDSSGMGLQNIKTRVESLKGKMEIINSENGLSYIFEFNITDDE